MKKFYFLFITLLITSLSFGQELILNGGFENWDNTTTPSNFDKAESTTQESTEFHSGTYSAKHTGGTSDISQTISGITPGTSYTISLWYKVDSNFGDGTDARIWSYWRTGTNTISDNANELRGPNNAYLDNNGNIWTQYSVTLTAPATADNFYFEVRTYGSAVVYYDDFSFFQEATVTPTLGITSPNDNDIIPGPDVPIEISVQNFNVANGTGDGYITYSLDGGSSVDKFDTNTINLTGLTKGSHSITLELVDNSGNPLSSPVTKSVSFTTYEIQTLPYIDHFDYSVDEALGGQTPWTNYFSGDEVLIQSGSLSYSSLNGTGNSIVFDGSGTDPVVDYTPTSSGKIYAAFMLKVTAFDASAVDGYFAVLRTDGGDYASRLWISPTSASTYRIGISNSSTLTQTNTPTTDYSLNETIFVVFNYDIDNNTVNAWINPTLGVTEPTPDISEASSSSGNTFSQFLIRQDSSTKTPSIVMDELIITTSWTAATPLALSNKTFNIEGFNMYPNPTSLGYVNIIAKSTSTMDITVFDLLGKQVIKQSISNTLDVSGLKAGVYIMKVTQDDAVSTRKLAIK
ncbi:T9SS type A sorting domain-containing protein [Aestuariibaculum marinum]|uniref:T9SS type A sorting domain-containing protein n=1 Tax=Aestuariibaculum marinum TaxID=2683592 RepID=A0A8J6Q2V8_9FLAO|nr:T9SS type A sorting domain-containing protein [Aestuariibaculum marinum]MBD0823644.1 T9SS type A sorting domain-containing protein [Aestuariibaculum marinum]